MRHLFVAILPNIPGKFSKFTHGIAQNYPRKDADEIRKECFTDIYGYKCGYFQITDFPTVVGRETESRRIKWFKSYIDSVLKKDVKELSNIEGLTDIPRILHLIATRVGSTINFSEIGRISDIKSSTMHRYLSLLENVFLILKIPAWTPNAEGQFVKSPKVFLNDTGLLCHLRGDRSHIK